MYKDNLKQCLKDVREHMQADFVLLLNPIHIYYYTGFMSEPHERFYCLLMNVQSEETALFLPSLDVEAAKQVAKVDQFIPVADGEDGFHVLKHYLEDTDIRFAVEKEDMSVAFYERLIQHFQEGSIVNVTPVIEKARLKKSPQEMEKTKRAIEITEKALEETLRHIQIGMTELSVKALLEYELKNHGAEQIAFDTIVLSGKNSALPHGVSSDKRIDKGDILLFDFGIYVNQYCSDITRTFIVGHAGKEVREMYETVKKANEAAITAVEVGKPLKDIDLAARKVIEQAGYGAYFSHRVGHGLGLDVHEAPSIHDQNEAKITKGLLFTIEPGIYIPEIGGVRIEDDIYVDAEGDVQVLTSYEKKLTILLEEDE